MSVSHWNDGRISKQDLQSFTGQKDLELVLLLNLMGLGICHIDSISDCVNLEDLDLSDNRLSCVDSLASLKMLSVLNLSANQITSVERGSRRPPHHSMLFQPFLPSFQLHMEEEEATSSHTSALDRSPNRLQCLSTLPKLRILRLQDLVHNHSNPGGWVFCPGGWVFCPGEKFRGRESDLYFLLREIDSSFQDSPTQSDHDFHNGEDSLKESSLTWKLEEDEQLQKFNEKLQGLHEKLERHSVERILPPWV
uniref:leucine-rich repeat-containing protein 61 n=1 Tax=Myxine glutinosa TaxID=7769 RepID=UPI00358FAAB5